MEMCITPKDKLYPKDLTRVKKPPKKLYYKGNLDNATFVHTLGVVGSRRMTKYGQQITKKLVCELAAQNIVIVSGFMYGIDATAHESALMVGGKTVAVLACGVNLVNPSHQVTLYNQIAKQGLILSEYPGEDVPQLWTYIQRNRIVAAISDAVLVVEAGESSGSLITANIALSLGKPVFCVPGNLSSVNSVGTLKLIKEGKASLVTSTNDILGFYGKSGAPLFRSKSTDPVVQLLLTEALTTDELTRSLGLSTSEVASKLTQLMLEGSIYQDGNKFYVNNS